MIEFELKFKINETKRFENMEKVSEKIDVDIYYDTMEYALIKEGNFVRLRNSKKIDFKVDIDDNNHLYCDERNFSIDTINSNNLNLLNLLKALRIDCSYEFHNFDEFINLYKWIEIARIKKKRIEYKLLENITIAIDEVEGLGCFLEAEVCMEESELKNSELIKANLIKVLVDNKLIDINYKLVNVGYVELYLYENNRDVYDLGKFKL